jgi:zinc/manganese transport system substrate-binding protein
VAAVKRVALVIVSVLVLAACGSSPSGGAGSANLNVVAAENFWGSIASQIAGSQSMVHSIIVNPATDPHSYEPTAQDGRALATAQLAIVNGVGYDPWAPKLLDANPAPGRITLTVGDLFGLHEGDNPHRWYDPANIDAVAQTIAKDLGQLDPKHASYFTAQLKAFETTGLAQYHRLIAQISSRYAGVPVGASESIFALQGPALHLKLLTPYSFMKAISEGTEPSAQDIITIQHQLATRQIKVWIYNSQNATPQIQRLNQLARAHGIPVATITETLDPPTASFQQWQASQLQRIGQALRQATGR